MQYFSQKLDKKGLSSQWRETFLTVSTNLAAVTPATHYRLKPIDKIFTILYL